MVMVGKVDLQINTCANNYCSFPTIIIKSSQMKKSVKNLQHHHKGNAYLKTQARYFWGCEPLEHHEDPILHCVLQEIVYHKIAPQP